MENGYEFFALDVRHLLLKIEEEKLYEWQKRITTKGHGEKGKIFSEHGVVQLCLLQTTPFQTNCDNAVLTLRTDAKLTRRTCPNRAMLIEQLADILLEYENILRDVKRIWQKIIKETPDAMHRIAETVGLYIRLRKLLQEKTPQTKLPPFYQCTRRILLIDNTRGR